MTYLLTFAMVLGLALLIGAATMLLLRLLLVAYFAYEKVARSHSRALTIAFVAIVTALAMHPDTAFFAAWVVILWLSKAAYVHTKKAFRRVGITSTRLQAAKEILGLGFLLALPCIALDVSVAFVVLPTLIVWLLANAIAKRRDWPRLMAIAGR